MRIVRATAAAVALSLLTAGAVSPAADASVSAHTITVHKLVGLHDPLAMAGDQFGHQVAMSAAGTEVLVGAHLSKGGIGAAYLYVAKSGKWVDMPSHTFADPIPGTNHFGFSVALSPDGKTAFVGADDTTVGARAAAGAVFIYQSKNGVWPAKPTQTLKDPGTGSSDYFGIGMSLSPDGGTLSIGAPGVTSNGVAEVGAVYVYDVAFRGRFPLAPSATIKSPTPTIRGDFGYSTSISNNASGKGSLVVGAYTTTVGSVGFEGAAYIFTSKGAHSWALAKGGSLSDPGGLGNDFFGGAVTIDGAGTLVMVGAQDESEKTVSDAGAAFSYAFKSGTWKKAQTFVGPVDGAANFGYPSVSTNGKVAVLAAPNEQIGSNNYAGEAFVYTGNGSTYAIGKSVPDPTGGSPTGQEYFGYPSAESATGGFSVIGAPATTGSGGNPGPGAVYVFSIV